MERTEGGIVTPTDLITTIKALLEYDNLVPRSERLLVEAPTLLAACVEALEGMGRPMSAVLASEQGFANRARNAEAEVTRLKDQIARMRPGTSGVLDELEAENARLKERVAELEAIPTLNMYRMAQDKRIAELEAKVEELEETVAAGDGNYDDNVKRIATLTAALERARPVVAARVPADQWKYATGWEGQLLDAIDAALSQARDGEEGGIDGICT